MTGVGTRIKKARESLSMTQVVLAKAVGISQQAVMELEAGRAKGTKHTAKFARALGQDPLWLETGEGRMREPARARRQAKGEAPSLVPELANYERIPVFDIRAPAPHGSIADHGQPIAYNMFRTDWLRGITRTPFSQLAAIQVAGDSMEPTLGNGDHILVDTSQLNLRREGLYVLSVDDTLMVKRVTMHPSTKRVTIKSDNDRYEAYRDLDPDNLDVLGRVIWLGRTLG